MLFLSMAKLKSIFFKEKYRKNIASKYDFYMKLLNDNECALPDLSIDAFQEFGIYTLGFKKVFKEKCRVRWICPCAVDKRTCFDPVS